MMAFISNRKNYMFRPIAAIFSGENLKMAAVGRNMQFFLFLINIIVQPYIYSCVFDCIYFTLQFKDTRELTHLRSSLYMFCIGLMMAVLQPKHVTLTQLIFRHCVDVHMLCFRQQCTYIYYYTTGWLLSNTADCQTQEHRQLNCNHRKNLKFSKRPC